MLNIYDALTRLNVIVECLKKERTDALAAVVWTMRGEIKKILANIAHENMGDMTRAELNAVCVKIVKMNSECLGVFETEMMDWLREFVDANSVMTKRVTSTLIFWQRGGEQDTILSPQTSASWFEDEQDNSDLTPLYGWAAILAKTQFDSLWSRISNAPSRATGGTLADTMAAFTASASLNVIKAVRAAWADNETVSAAAAGIVGTAVNGTGGTLDRVLNAGRATVNTVIQQASQSTGSAIQSALSNRYRWDSIMDSVTTEICRSRNGKVYVFGEGPLPPAHMNCRSHITALLGDDVGNSPDTFYNWASTQPVAFLREVFDADKAESLAKGTAKASDFNGFQATKALTIPQFNQTITSILST